MSYHINITRVLFVPQIVGDAVGWGFVVRGSKPCHIQAVDPGGPAAAAGMKVRLGEMYGVLSLSGLEVEMQGGNDVGTESQV